MGSPSRKCKTCGNGVYPKEERPDECRRCFNKRTKPWLKPQPRRSQADRHYRSTYGITLDQYEALSRAQDDRCAICREVEATKRLAVDHDHKTGKVRALLCDLCNRGLGLFRDDPELITHAATYLRGFTA